MEIVITIQRNVPFQRIADVLITAFEAGTYGAGYWAKIYKYVKPPKLEFRCDPENIYPYADYPLNEGGAVLVRDSEDPGKTFKLDIDAVKRGLQLMADKRPKDWENFLNENDDGDTADTFLQLCLLGDVIYG